MSEPGRFGPLVGAIDAGTSSVRFIVFCPRNFEIITWHQLPLKIICPESGWVEQDPIEIINLINKCISATLEKLQEMEIEVTDIYAIGITNQRETVVIWNKKTGAPFCNAIG